MKKIIEARKISKYFEQPERTQVLFDVDLSIEQGEFISLVGKSGCGKSTLLYILSTMDTDYQGELFIDGQLITDLPHQALAEIRNEKIGFVFQFHYLLEEFSVLKNVMLPALKLNQLSSAEIEAKAYECLKKLDIADLALKMANRLSGGQKQRVAIARALINDPLIIMGDEPTGNLDKRNSEIVFEIFQSLTLENKQTMLIVTHDLDFAAKTNRSMVMSDGRML